MKKAIKTRSLYLIVIGLLLISGDQIIVHFKQFPDPLNGLITGIGIGLMLTSIILIKYKAVK